MWPRYLIGEVGRKQKKLISEREFWVFWGIILVARLEGKQGENCWESKELEGYRAALNLSQYMTCNRHREIRGEIMMIFADVSREHSDPWWKNFSTRTGRRRSAHQASRSLMSPCLRFDRKLERLGTSNIFRTLKESLKTLARN